METKNQNRSTGLFKPEVYLAMQERLQGSSRYRGAEEAFEMFYADRQLQDFLRAYAKKEDIVESKEKGYRYPPIPRFSQAGEDRHILLIDDKMHATDFDKCFGARKAGIYIGPRQDGDAALMTYTHLGEIIPYQTTGIVAGEIIKDKTWKIECYTYFGGCGDNTKFDGKRFSVSQAPLFQRIIKQDILMGLEKAISELIEEVEGGKR
ncbi:hypothetical protein FJZ19_00360 [Candidatus Pacearchaeota archaeon]|nr:hypothetical protein [Candidatus Pacearchaeota archaeon]